MLRVVPLVLALVAAPAFAQEPVTTFVGEAIYTEFITLPDDAEITVALREAAGGVAGAVVSRGAEPTRGAQAPIPFRLEVPSRLLVPQSPYAFEVTLRLPEGVRWQSDPVTVEPAGETVEVGTTLLRSQEPMASPVRLRCGDTTVRFAAAGERAVLEVRGRRLTMIPTPAASGARYEAEDDPSTVFWSRGTEAMLTLDGEELPTCRQVADPVSGRHVLPGDWVVETIGGRSVLDDAPDPTLVFTEDGRLAGQASCNRYTASYAVNGERLAVDPRIAVTQMACPSPIMEQERAFLDALTSADGWSVEGGALVLTGEAMIRARRPAE